MQLCSELALEESNHKKHSGFYDTTADMKKQN